MKEKQNILSPLTLKENCEIVEKLEISEIIKDYKTKYKVNVSRFYSNLGNDLKLYLCKETGYRFYSPKSLAGDGQFYQSLLESDKYYSEWKNEYEMARLEALKLKSDGLKILDIGCGYGSFLKGLRDVGIIGDGLEFNETAVNHCVNNGFNVKMESIEYYSINNSNQYDVVCAFQVLEHVFEVNSFIKSCLNCLKPNGLLIFAVPNNEPYYAGYHNYAISNVPPHHMGLWNLSVFQKIQSIFNIKLIAYKYDLKISFPYFVLFKSKYLLNKVFKKSNKLSFAISTLISLFLFPIELLNLTKLKKKTLFGTIITIFKKV